MNLSPLADYVQIKIRTKVLKSGIIVSSDDMDEVADVIAVGPDVTKVKVGDAVFFDKFAGTILETKFDRIIKEDDILAKIED